jgi:C4-type Zn-finger protein
MRLASYTPRLVYTPSDFVEYPSERKRCPACGSTYVFSASGFLDAPEADDIEVIVARCEDCGLTAAEVLS